MAIDRQTRAEELFQQASKLAPEQREEFLAEQCGSDAGLRIEVQELLSLDDTQMGSFLESPAAESITPADDTDSSSLPSQIGRYSIIRRIGEGGMGMVYEARQEAPQRTVALKLIRPGIASEQMVRRFKREAELLGRLQNSGIAQIYEAGTSEIRNATGDVVEQPYLAMEFVRGRPLTEHADTHKLDTRRRLELLASVCDAVQYAHENGIVHRDLKPGNILVDERGEPKILDFGVARLTGSNVGVTTIGTDFGQLIGTIPYMSPEQVLGDARDLDARSDVYALGVILYQLLTGRLPYDLENKSLLESMRIIREEEPTALGSINKRYRGDIETIVARAVEKERHRRYRSAAELAGDVRRFLNDEPISARPASALYQLRKFARRHKGLVGGVACAFLVLVIGFVTTTVGLVRARGSERLAKRQGYRTSLAAAAEALIYDDAVTARGYLEAAPAEYRNWVWRYLRSRTDTSRIVLRGHKAEVAAVAFAPDGTLIASASLDGTVRLWNVATGDETGILTHDAGVSTAAFSPDGSRLVAGCADGSVTLWDWRSTVRIATFKGHGGRVSAIAFDPEGERIASAAFDKTLRVWNAHNRTELFVAQHEDRVTSVAFTPDGKNVVTACWTGAVYVWDGATGRKLAHEQWHPHVIFSAALSSDGARLATASADHTVGVHAMHVSADNDVAWKNISALRGHAGFVRSVCFNPDGSRLVSSAEDQTVRVWDAASAREIAVLNGHTGAVLAVRFSPDGTIIASASADGTVRLWDATDHGRVAVLTGHESYVYPVAFSPDGAFLASGSWDNTVRLWDPSTGRQVGLLKGHEQEVTALSFSRDGSRLATASAADTLRIWNPITQKELLRLCGHSDDVYGVAFSTDGLRIASASRDKTVRFWEAATGREQKVLHGHLCPVTCVAFSPDGNRLASASTDGTVRLWDAVSGDPLPDVAPLAGHQGSVNWLSFSPNGLWLATAGNDHTVRLWNVRTGQLTRILRGHTGVVYGVVFTPDGTRIASGADDQTIRIWDPITGDMMAILRGHEHYVYSVAFSPEGRWPASGSGDHTVRLWDSAAP